MRRLVTGEDKTVPGTDAEAKAELTRWRLFAYPWRNPRINHLYNGNAIRINAPKQREWAASNTLPHIIPAGIKKPPLQSNEGFPAYSGYSVGVMAERCSKASLYSFKRRNMISRQDSTSLICPTTWPIGLKATFWHSPLPAYLWVRRTASKVR